MENKSSIGYVALTKENFFNDLGKDYPEAMKRFNEWIDDYKQRNNFDSLFNSAPTNLVSIAPKYHELPRALQVGIFIEFATEVNPDYSYRELLQVEFVLLFQEIELDVKNRKLKALLEVKSIVDSGYAGVLPNGNIVDRRDHPEAIAMQRNILLGIPETKQIPPPATKGAVL